MIRVACLKREGPERKTVVGGNSREAGSRAVWASSWEVSGNRKNRAGT